MAGQIRVSYSVMEQVINNVDKLAGRAQTLASTKSTFSISKGKTATALQEALEIKSEFASVLSAVMAETAYLLRDAESQMKEADASAAAQYSPGSYEVAQNAAEFGASALVDTTPQDSGRGLRPPSPSHTLGEVLEDVLRPGPGEVLRPPFPSPRPGEVLEDILRPSPSGVVPPPFPSPTPGEVLSDATTVLL